ncbi:hypothetical protein N7493_009574 [Penicillium malachiteum]|uniref:Uncharacterized protein n=1 Tax=Penicillium malachiteum TaxID=1324776 RepID=A0AAD6HEF1_9EURO|nr:hypothetical protein N7493_009574 [Penicillium malachiteum]
MFALKSILGAAKSYDPFTTCDLVQSPERVESNETKLCSMDHLSVLHKMQEQPTPTNVTGSTTASGSY